MEEQKNKGLENDAEATVSSSMQESIEKALMQAGALPYGISGHREIDRPDINIWKMALCFLLRLLPAAAVTAAAALIPQTRDHVIAAAACAAALTLFFNFRRLVTGLILIYQRYAPEKLRAACIYEPSCSNYMLMAMEKYGTVKGIIKGIKRLMRCRYPNTGGIDYP